MLGFALPLFRQWWSPSDAAADTTDGPHWAWPLTVRFVRAYLQRARDGAAIVEFGHIEDTDPAVDTEIP